MQAHDKPAARLSQLVQLVMSLSCLDIRTTEHRLEQTCLFQMYGTGSGDHPS